MESTTDYSSEIDEAEDAILAKARAKANAIAKGQHFKDWVIIGNGFMTARQIAFRVTRTRDPKSKYYRNYVSGLMLHYKLHRFSPSTRNALYWMMENLQEVQAWYEDLPAAKRTKWTHPETIKKHFPQPEDFMDETTAKPTKDRAIALNEQWKNASKLQVNATASASDLARFLAKNYDHDLLREMIQILTNHLDQEQPTATQAKRG